MSIIITGLTADDKVPGVYNQLKYSAGKRNSATAPVYLYLMGNMRSAVSASIGAVTRVGGSGPVVGTSGTPTADREFIVEITTGGALGVAVFKWTNNDGQTYTTGVTAGATVALSDGVSITMAAGTYVVAETYSFSTVAAATFGTATAATIYDIDTIDRADALFGPGAELDIMAEDAIAIPGVNLRAIAVAEAGGGVAATMTVTFSGTWTAGGTLRLRLDGKNYTLNVASTDTITTLGWRAQDAFNGVARCPVVADSDVGVMTLRVKTKGVRGNMYSLWVDTTDAPAGLVVTLTGGTAMTGPPSGSAKYFSGGSGADDVTAALATLLPVTNGLFAVIAPAQNDAVNLALIKAQIDTKSGPLVQQYEQLVVGHTGTQAAVTALSQTTLNYAQAVVVFDEESETHPSRIAAQFGAMRAVYEGLPRGSNTVESGIPNGGPNCNYDGAGLPTMPIRDKSAISVEVNHSKLKALLNAGVTPLATVGGKKVIVRAITSHSLDGITPDYRTLDVGEATVPIVMSRRIAAAGYDFMAANPYAGPDPDQANGESDAPEGIATPSAWNVVLQSLLQSAATDKLIYKLSENLPVVEWDADTERIMSSTPLSVRPLNHQIGNEVRQV
jgi:phage tail sheath gpL-like